MAGMQVASGKFSMATGEAEITILEFGSEFLAGQGYHVLAGKDQPGEGRDL